MKKQAFNSFNAASFGFLNGLVSVMTGEKPGSAPYFLYAFSEEAPPPPQPDRRIYGELGSRDILVKPEEIGDGFTMSYYRTIDDNTASVEFNHRDMGVTVNVNLQKKIDEAAHDRAKKDYVTMTKQKMSI